MKRLVVQLLRLGDILMVLPVLKAIKEQYPQDELHILINKQFSHVKPILDKYVDEVFLFDRSRIQKSLASADSPMLESYDLIKQVIKKLNDEKYDEIINFTQNKLSGRIVDQINASIKFGLQLDNSNLAKFFSPWFSYLEDHVAGGVKSHFHYVDTLIGGSGLDNQSGFKSTTPNNLSNYFCIQTATSDAKKTIPIEQWETLLNKLFLINKTPIVLFAGPSEEGIVSELNKKLTSNGVNSSVYADNLQNTLAKIANSSGLVTVDTSIKHLGALTDVPIIELAIGSSQPSFTGVYRDNCLIISSKEACAPCPHSQPCSKSSQLCATSFESEVVSSLISNWFNKDLTKVKLLASNVRFQLKVEQTYLNNLGFWTTLDLGREFLIDDIDTLIDKTVWKAFLDRSHTQAINQIGTYSYNLTNFINEQVAGVKVEALKLRLNKYEQQIISQNQMLSTLLNKLYVLVKQSQQAEKSILLKEFSTLLGEYLLTEKWSRPLKEAHRTLINCIEENIEPQFAIIRRIQIEINDALIRNNSKIKISQNIRNSERKQYEQQT